MGEKDTIPALERAIELIHAVAEGNHFLSIADLSRKTDIPQTTCYRIVRTLIDADWLRPRGQGQGYELSFGLLPLLKPFDDHRVLISVVHPAITDLVEQTGLSAKVSVASGQDAVTIHRVDCHRPIALTGRIGVHFHLAHGSSGAALLSGMEDERIQEVLDAAPQTAWERQSPRDVWQRVQHDRMHGWCLDRGGYLPQVHTVSAALRRGAGGPWAALTLLGMPGDLDDAAGQRTVDQLMGCVERCHQALHVTKEAVS